MDRWMNSQTEQLMDGWMNKQNAGYMDEWMMMDGRKDDLIYGWINGSMDKQNDRWMDGWIIDAVNKLPYSSSQTAQCLKYRYEIRKHI